MTLPPRINGPRKEPKLKLVFRPHEKWVREHDCILHATGECGGPIILFHVDRAGHKGVSKKVPSWSTVSCCDDHHKEYHQIGTKSFERKYNIDLVALANEFAERSPQSQEMWVARKKLEDFYRVGAA